MKKATAFLLSLIFLLTACTAKETNVKDSTEMAGGTAELNSAADAEAAEWTGTGGCYKLMSAISPPNAQNVISASGQLYFTTSTDTIQDNVIEYNEELQTQDSTTLYSSGNNLIFCEGADGIWVSEYDYIDGEGYTVFTLVSPDGEILRRFTYQTCDGRSVRYMVCASDMLYLTLTTRCLEVVSEYGERVCVIDSTKDSYDTTVLGSDGQAYAIYESDTGCDVYTVDTGGASIEYQFSTSDGTAFSGNAYCADSGWLFLFENDTGLFGIGAGGEETPIVIWSECNITPSYLLNVIPMEDNFFSFYFTTERT